MFWVQTKLGRGSSRCGGAGTPSDRDTASTKQKKKRKEKR